MNTSPRIACLLCVCLIQQANYAKTVIITGPLVAPWIREGQLCLTFYAGSERKICQLLGAGQDFIFTIPDNVRRIHITRILNGSCRLAHSTRSCRQGRGSFTIKGNQVKLNLTQHAGHIRHHHTHVGPYVEPTTAFRSPSYYSIPSWSITQDWKTY